MAKVKTERFSFDGSVRNEVQFSTDINVSKEGLFSTTLPKDIVELLESAQINTGSNQLKNKGYFTNTTYGGLVSEIRNCVKEFLSKTLIGERIVIKYAIKTSCAYVLDIDGCVVPNAGKEWTRLEERAINDWKNGTVSQHAANCRPFGIEVYAKPYLRKEFKYGSGQIKIEYEYISASYYITSDENDFYLRWLGGVTTIAVPDESHLQEIDYSEEVAKVFVDMLKGICVLNEKIKDFLTPESIKIIANSGKRLLG